MKRRSIITSILLMAVPFPAACRADNNESYIKVKGVNFGTGAKSFDARVASAADGGNIELRLDSPVGPLVGTCAVPGTGGRQTWTTRSCQVRGAAGTHDLYLRFTGGSSDLFNFDWWQFRRSHASPTGTPRAARQNVTPQR